jgi:hypothetical protein
MPRRRKSKRATSKGADSSNAGLPAVRSDGTRDWSYLEARARRETTKNVGQIEAGETFRAQKDTRPEKAPSKGRGGRLS